MGADELPAHAGVGALARLVDDARDRGFVGRGAELMSFAEALSGSSGTRVVFLHGAGGMGKTTLLDAYARYARSLGRRAVYLDARDVECSAEAVTSMVAARSVDRSGSRSGVGSDPPGGADAPDVLLIDGYELLEPLDRWFWMQLLPSRPAGSVTVVAGRTAPALGWRTDPGWRRLVQVHELTEFGRDESDEVLARLGVPAAGRATLARLARGHPLVLALLAEASRAGAVPMHLADAPDVVSQLCRIIIDDIPDAAHRSGLATCAHATRMTQDLLTCTVGSRAEEVWRWLESRPYVRRGAVGLFLHDVVRELFETEFAQRSPDVYVELHRVTRGYFLRRIFDPTDPHHDRAAAEILLMHRRGPLAAQTAALREGGLLSISHADAEDAEGIVDLIEHGEGRVSGELARRWARDQPRSLYRVRSDDGVEAFAMHVYLPTTTTVGSDDPVAVGIMRVVEEHGPLRPGERVHINRFAGATGHYQRDPMLLLVNGVSSILEWAHQPAAWTFVVTFEPQFYGPYFEYLGMSPMLRMDVDGLELCCYGWDRRRFPVTGLFELMARRELSGETGPPPPELLRPVPLSRPEFESAVRAALQCVRVPDRLGESPLLGSALIDGAAKGGAAPNRIDALRGTLLTAIESLGAERRGAEHRRVLERTYLKGARSQEAAAELLDLPFSTYRRHLTQAHDRIVELLWSVEIGERVLPDPLADGHEVSSS